MTQGLFYRRTAGLDCNAIEDGYFVADRTREKVHFLNRTAAAVFELCDGDRDAPAIALALSEIFGLATSPQDDVETCLASLAERGLIEPSR